MQVSQLSAQAMSPLALIRATLLALALTIPHAHTCIAAPSSPPSATTDPAKPTAASAAGRPPRAPRPPRPTRGKRPRRTPKPAPNTAPPSRPSGNPPSAAPPPASGSRPPAPSPAAPPVAPVAAPPPSGGVPAPSTPDRPPPPPAEPGKEGDLRLVGRVDVNGFATGAVQVNLEGTWGAVCSKGFGDVDAAVACRQLGFDDGFAIDSALPALQFTTDFIDPPEALQGFMAPFLLGDLGCSGDEARLADCPADDAFVPRFRDRSAVRDYREPTQECDAFAGTYAFAACGTAAQAEEGDLRLAGGAVAEGGGAEYGRLEVFHRGGWGTVCDIADTLADNTKPQFDFGQAAADAACRQLGYSEGFPVQPRPEEQEGNLGRVPIMLAVVDLGCGGGEARLADCPGYVLRDRVSVCGHQADVSIVCSSGADDRDGDLRLVGGGEGDGYEYGRLEVFLRGFWSAVCSSERFTPDSAAVACRALGYAAGASLEFRFPDGESQVLLEKLPVALAAVNCDGTEDSLLDCTSSIERIRTCGLPATNSSDVTVLACGDVTPECEVAEPVEGALRLRGGSGTPCDPLYTGFTEIFHSGAWGAVCNNFEADPSADVICRQLGFPYATPVNSFIARPEPDYDNFDREFFPRYAEEAEEEEVEIFWLRGVQCGGLEEELSECDLGVGFRALSGCERDRLHVACRKFPVEGALEAEVTPGAEEGDLRLVEEEPFDNWVTGRLEVFLDSTWSQVCAAGFEGVDAAVACRQLGYGAGTIATPTFFDSPAADPRQLLFPPVAVTRSGCAGTEARLADCGREEDFPNISVSRRCTDTSDYDRDEQHAGLFVACVANDADGQEGAVRMRGGEATEGTEWGFLEVFHSGAWGGVCQANLPDEYYFNELGVTEESGTVACKELGYADGFVRRVDRDSIDAQPAPAWLGALRCAGGEASLAACDKSAFGDVVGCGDTLRLFCYNGGANVNGTVRLVGGRAAAGGDWEYGRVTVANRGFFSGLNEEGNESLGRRGTQVACRSLGYSTGAQVIVGRTSALPGPAGLTDSVSRYVCRGDEVSLEDCEFELSNGFFADAEYDDGAAVAIICSSADPEGCTPEGQGAEPAQGDVRLVALQGTGATSVCDAVHAGIIEIFNDGVWGRICQVGSQDSRYTLIPQVVCRQLGFPFGGQGDSSGESLSGVRDETFDYQEYNGEPSEPNFVWATQVVCTGAEERLDACFFQEARGGGYGGPGDSLGLPEGGVPGAFCTGQDQGSLTAVCRTFEIPESKVIR